MKNLQKLKKSFFDELSFFFISPALIWQVLFFIIPLLFIIALSFVNIDTHVVTFNYYATLIQLVYVKIIIRSVLLALITAVLCLLCAYPVAYWLTFFLKKYKTVGLFFLILPFWTNLLVLVYAWFFVLEKQGVLNNVLISLGIITEPLSIFNTIIAVIIVMVYCYFPFMLLPLVSTLEKFDRTLIEASYDLGATTRQTFLRVILPLSMPGVLTGFFLVFVPSFGEFAIPSLVGGDKNMFVGMSISHYFLIARNSSMGAAFTCVSALILAGLMFGIVYYFARILKELRG